MTVPETILTLAGAAFVGLLGYGLWCDPIRPWIEEMRWRHDQQRLELRLRDRDMARRAYLLEVRAMEEHAAMLLADSDPDLAWFEQWFSLPCAPDPTRRLA